MERYAAYKDSGVEWIGEIPAGWEVKRFKYLFDLITDKAKEGLTKIGLENIESESGKLIKTNSEFEGDGIHFVSGDILFGKLRPYLAKVYLSNFQGNAVGDFFVFRTKGEIYQRFGSNLILSKRFIEITNGSTFGSKMPRVSWDFIANLKVAYPTINEQTAIANYLDRKTGEIDALIAQKQRLIELYQEEKTAIINKAVTQGIGPNGKLKDSGIDWLGEIPDGWEVSRLKNICSVRQGLQIPISERVLRQTKDCLPYITIKSINNPDDTKEFIENPSKNVVCSKDDILVARTGATGEIITDVEGAFHNNFFLVDYDRKQVIKSYLINFLKSPKIKEYLLLVAGTTTIPDLNHDAFYCTPFFVLTFLEQAAIVRHIETETARIDAKIAKTKRIIELQKEYRTALISEVVTGKIKVSHLADKEAAL
jgi:type I restriction enzyme, S subunit